MRYLHTMVRVSDLDASLDFYCGKLGLVEVRRMGNEKGRFTLVFLATPDDAKRIKAHNDAALATDTPAETDARSTATATKVAVARRPIPRVAGR